jgi:hypothetical protein
VREEEEKEDGDLLLLNKFPNDPRLLIAGLPA